MAPPTPEVSICTWPFDAPFAYSMTYDEGTVDCLANALPVHEQFGFPGHVDVVAGQLGRQRQGWGSSLNDYVHMSAEEIRFLLRQGWGVGNHSWSHYIYPTQAGLDLWREVVWSKYTLEDQLQHPVRIFTIPNDKHNYEPVLELVRQHYIGCAYIDGAPNREGFDLYKIGNFMVASGEISPHYDWKRELLTDNLSLDFLRDSWLYETTHLVMWNVPQAHKCITPEDLTRRFARLQEISDGRLWAAKPDDVLDYVRLRRHVGLQVVHSSPGEVSVEFTGTWPLGTVNPTLCLRVTTNEPRVSAAIEYRPSPLPGGGLFQAGECRCEGTNTYCLVDAVPGARVTVRVYRAGDPQAGPSDCQ